MAQVEVKLYGTPELLKKMQNVQGFFQNPKLLSILTDAKDAYVLLAQIDVPKRTRFLRSSIHGVVEGFGTTDPRVRVGAGGAGAGYAKWVEEGTKPHPIFPIRRKWLHWFEDGSGASVPIPYGVGGTDKYNSRFSKGVQHPGTAAQPFFYKQMRIIGPRLTQALSRLLGEEMNRAV